MLLYLLCNCVCCLHVLPAGRANHGFSLTACGIRNRAEFMEGKIQTFLDVNLLKGDRKQLWVNPDCGLKTREWSQVPPAPC